MTQIRAMSSREPEREEAINKKMVAVDAWMSQQGLSKPLRLLIRHHFTNTLAGSMGK
jgi:hypothetical protein